MGIDSASALSNVRNILIARQHDQLGDMLCAVPLMRALRQSFPTAHITLVTRPVNHEIMLSHPCIDEVLRYDKTPIGGIVKFIRKLRSRPYDLAVVPATVSISTTSNLIAFLSGAKIRIGPRSLNGKRNRTAWCFTTNVDLGWNENLPRHQTLRNLDVLAPLKIMTTDLSHRIGLTDEEKREAKAHLAPLREKHRILAGFHPGAGKAPNRWSAKRFAALAEQVFRKHGAGIVLTAGPMDDEPIREMISHLLSPYHIVKNQPIRRVAAIIDQLDLYVTNDTGVLHIAGATSPRVIALFGPTDPRQWMPIGLKNRYLHSKDGNIDSISIGDAEELLKVVMMEIERDLKLL